MKRRVSFHPITKWIPIGKAKIRKKLGRPRGKACSIAASLEDVEEIGFGLGHFPAISGKFSPSKINRADRFFQHQFRVLGAEWKDLPGHAELPRGGAEYQPIDWKPYYGKGKGEDCKLPWELSRFHSFAEMAYLAQAEEKPWVDLLGREILNQLRDFSESNPVGAGAHWGCAMDVSLRALNITIACDLLRSAGWQATQEETAFLSSMIRSHGRFIFRNLEWYRVGRGNHYLANLLGLVAISLWLPLNAETETWLDFASAELMIESDRQFLPDGSNFEGSVFYHRLSLELLALGYALLQGPGRRKKRWDGDLLPLAAKIQAGLAFLRDLTDNSGHGVQFGDHDSGRALKIDVPEIEFDGRVFEDALSTADTLSLGRLFEGTDSAGALGDLALWLAGQKIKLSPARGASRSKISGTQFSDEAPGDSVRHEFPVPLLDLNNTQFGYYGDFGVYIWKNQKTELWIRCGFPSQDGHGGHAHFDQLHLELRIDGRPVVFDPGSLSYTGDRFTRNLFRSPVMHFIPRLPERESLADQSVDAFRYPGLPVGECLSANASGFSGRYRLGDQVAYRKIKIERDKICVWDWAEGGALQSTVPSPDFVSWGYGERVRWPLHRGAR